MNAPLRHPVAIVKERPFDGRPRVLPVDWSAERTPSIADILAAQTDLQARFVNQCVARVNGELVPRVFWPFVRPKRGAATDVVVTFTLPLGNPGRGGNGAAPKKNPVTTVAEIAVLLAATVVSAGALGPVTAGVLGAGIGASVAGAAIGIGGALEISALKPAVRA